MFTTSGSHSACCGARVGTRCRSPSDGAGDRRDHAAVRGDLRRADEAAASPNANRLVLLNGRAAATAKVPGVQRCRVPCVADSPRTVEGLAAWSQRSATLTGSGDPERVRVVTASAGLFQALGVTPLIGSPFTEADESRAREARSSCYRSPVAPALQRQSRRARPAVRLDGEALYRGRRPRGRDGVPNRTIRAWLRSGCRPSPQLTGDVQCEYGRPPDSTPSQAAAEGTSRGRDVPDTAMTTTAIFGNNGAVRRDRDADTGCGDRRRPAPADGAACRGRAAAARRDRERGQPAARARDDAAA